MKITKTSLATGKVHTKEINVTDEQLKRWANGTLIQTAMPHLSADDREFLISGITSEEWEEIFGDCDENN